MVFRGSNCLGFCLSSSRSVGSSLVISSPRSSRGGFASKLSSLSSSSSRRGRKSLFTTGGGTSIVAAASLSLALLHNTATAFAVCSAATTTVCDGSSSFGSSSISTPARRNTVTMMSSSNNDDLMTGYLNASDAAALDEELMSSPGFSLEQLMELAGLSVAEAVYQVIGQEKKDVGDDENKKKRILLICGPGNNGGDGLVAARHLVFFGFDCVVVYPKRSKKTHFVNLVQQCEDVGIPILDGFPDDGDGELRNYSAIVDAIFGFSFKGAPREPFATALEKMRIAQSSHGVPVLSVDVPSGWNVDEGDVAGTGFVPQVLISLTTPKESARGFTGRHFVGGRFLPPKLAEKYNVKMPPYPGVSQVMEVSTKATIPSSTTETATEGKSLSWEAEYAAYLEAKYREEKEDEAKVQPTRIATTNTDEPSSVALASPKVPDEGPSSSSWEAQYAAYCAEKEARLVEEDAKRRAATREEANVH